MKPATQPVTHTPGPWEILLSQRIHGGFDVAVAFRFKEKEEAQANARLIAAAPELLEALQFVNRVYSTIGGVLDPEHYGLIANSDECGKMINAVRAAIRKATGAEGTQGEQR